jgi:hypothetical protein
MEWTLRLIHWHFGLEHFPSLLNRAGFPKRGRSDSSCVLAEEAGMHGESAVG